MIVAMVHHKSIEKLNSSIDAWLSQSSVRMLYILDNSEDEEIRKQLVERTRNNNQLNLIITKNKGYGSGLNQLVKLAKSELQEKEILLFGNCDIVPTHKIKEKEYEKIPMLNIAQDKIKNLNPVMGVFECKLLFAYTKKTIAINKYIRYYLWIMIHKILRKIPINDIGMVHGAMFALTKEQIEKIGTIFDESNFLYCEEMYFAKKIIEHGYKYEQTNIYLEHEGGVSTKLFNKKISRRMLNWEKSMNIFVDNVKNK